MKQPNESANLPSQGLEVVKTGKNCCFISRCEWLQAAVRSAQASAKAKVDEVVAEIKATPSNVQKGAVKAGEIAVIEVWRNPEL